MNEQEKREQVIIELSDCIEILRDIDSSDCSKGDRENLHMSILSAIQDAIDLLKAQEPKKAKQVILQRLGSDALIGYECGNCGKHINQNDKYCHECGQAVKWE